MRCVPVCVLERKTEGGAVSDSVKRYMWCHFLLGGQESPYVFHKRWCMSPMNPKHNTSSAHIARHSLYCKCAHALAFKLIYGKCGLRWHTGMERVLQNKKYQITLNVKVNQTQTLTYRLFRRLVYCCERPWISNVTTSSCHSEGWSESVYNHLPAAAESDAAETVKGN